MKSISRRNLFKYGVGAAGVGGGIVLGGDLLGARGVSAKTATTPDAAIAALTQGNQRFSQQKMTQKNRNSFRLRLDTGIVTAIA